jgi:predicted amidophosphoribosyltransferase
VAEEEIEGIARRVDDAEHRRGCCDLGGIMFSPILRTEEEVEDRKDPIGQPTDPHLENPRRLFERMKVEGSEKIRSNVFLKRHVDCFSFSMILSLLTRLLLPVLCPSCGVALLRPGLCPSCEAEIGRLGIFRRVRGPPSVPCWGGAAYRGAVRSLLYAYKFRRRRDLAEVAAGWAVEALGRAMREGGLTSGMEAACRSLKWCIVPAPPSRSRVASRGYDPVEPIAQAVARAARLPILRAVVRVRDGPPQSGLPRGERKKNVQGVFAPLREGGLARLGVLLVDDVVTSGATLAALAEAARAAGAVTVLAVTAAIAVPSVGGTPSAFPGEGRCDRKIA